MCGFGMWLVNPPVAQGREWNTPSKCSWEHRAWRWGREECHSTQNSQELQTWREVRLRNVCVGPGVFRIGTHLIDSLLVQTGRVRQAKCRLCGTRGGESVGISHSNCKLRTLGFSDPGKSLFLSQTGSQWEPDSAASLGASSEPHWWRHYCLYWDRATPNLCFLLIFPLFCPIGPVCVAPDQACGYHILCNVYSGACSALPLLLVQFIRKVSYNSYGEIFLRTSKKYTFLF